MKIPPDCKTCKSDCRIEFGSCFKTLVQTSPIFDKTGIMLNAYPNLIYGDCYCITCNKHWEFEEKDGMVKWKQIYAN